MAQSDTRRPYPWVTAGKFNGFNQYQVAWFILPCPRDYLMNVTFVPCILRANEVIKCETQMPHKYLLKEFEEFARSAPNAESLMQHVSQRIHLHIPRYNWVGFYLVDKRDSAMLVLGPHAGSFTPNPKISFNEGLCGSAASTRRIMVADNVAEDPRYLQCSDLVRSQISVPVMATGKMSGVFNVESYFMATFKPAQERTFVEACAKIVGNCFERTVAHDLVNV
jgi:L-methionine (R)-S-oxide reductase